MTEFEFKFEFEYVRGNGIPDIPVIYIALHIENRRVGGPALVDTGFDGGIYPNEYLYDYLSKFELKSDKEETLIDVTGKINCKILYVTAEIFDPDSDLRYNLGKVKVYLPESREYISDNVIVGREIINNLDIRLNGKDRTLKILGL